MTDIQYEIVETYTGRIVETITEPWETTKERVKTLNLAGKGVFARKVLNNAKEVAKRSLETILEPGINYIFVDAWTSGNPGKGGCRGVDSKGHVLFEHKSILVHSNNFFELYAIVSGLDKLAVSGGIVYSDSATAISWINNGYHNASADIKSINKLIAKAKNILRKNNVILKKWDTSLYGEIPADYGRK